MYKAINNIREQKGFTLIGLLIVVAIIGILAAIAVPAYIGAQEKARKSNLNKAAKSAESDLSNWLNSALKGVVATLPVANLIEVDTDWDGSVTAADCTNLQLFGAGPAANMVVADYAATRSMVAPACNGTSAHYGGAPEVSPWQGMVGCAAGTTLFIAGADPGPAPAVGTQCQVLLAAINPNTIRVVASDNGPGGGGGATQLLSSNAVSAE